MQSSSASIPYTKLHLKAARCSFFLWSFSLKRKAADLQLTLRSKWKKYKKKGQRQWGTMGACFGGGRKLSKERIKLSDQFIKQTLSYSNRWMFAISGQGYDTCTHPHTPPQNIHRYEGTWTNNPRLKLCSDILENWNSRYGQTQSKYVTRPNEKNGTKRAKSEIHSLKRTNKKHQWRATCRTCKHSTWIWEGYLEWGSNRGSTHRGYNS